MLQCAQNRTGHAGRPITYWDSNPSWAMKSKLTQVYSGKWRWVNFKQVKYISDCTIKMACR